MHPVIAYSVLYLNEVDAQQHSARAAHKKNHSQIKQWFSRSSWLKWFSQD